MTGSWPTKHIQYTRASLVISNTYSSVDGQSLIDVHPQEVIISTSRTWDSNRVRLGWFGHQAKNRIGVALSA